MSEPNTDQAEQDTTDAALSATETDETAAPVQEDTPETEQAPVSDETPEPETFPAEYVRQLRKENAEHRTRAKDRDEIAQRLHVELVRATGRLADPTDLPFDEDHLADADKMVAAIDALLTAKPHLASRRPTGDIGQGATASAAPVDLAAILRANAG